MKNFIKSILLLLAAFLVITRDVQGQLSDSSRNDLAAENMLLWQRSNGGWPKDTYNIFFDDTKEDKKNGAVKVLIDYKKEQTAEQKKLAVDTKDFKDATIDNSHTVKEIRYLLQAYKSTGNSNYLLGAEKGINYLFTAQYPNGGWPQFYPDKKSYKHQITFNDNAMANVMNLMLDISKGINNTEVLDKKYLVPAQKAFDKGVDIILKTQLKINGKKAVWCAQYDEITLQPDKARAYELPSLSGSESVELVRILMRIENPSAAIEQAVTDAVNWFEESKIAGYKTERIIDVSQPKGVDVVVVPDASSVMWARFYDLETNKPFFCDRDGIKKSTLAEIGIERRTGYAWYGVWPLKLIAEEYIKWKNKNSLNF